MDVRPISVASEAELAPDACGRQLRSGRWCNHRREHDGACRMHAYSSSTVRRERRTVQQAALERERARACRRRELIGAAEQARLELQLGYSVLDGEHDPRRLAVLMAQLVAAVDRWEAADSAARGGRC